MRFWNRLFYLGSGKGQFPKQPALDVKGLPGIGLTDLVAPAGGFPTEVPVSFFKVGGMRLAAVPFEMTSLAGFALKERLGNPDNTLAVGLANEYFSYLATPKEYQEQDYEGASTLYGVDSLSCLEELFGTIETAGPEKAVAPRRFDAGPAATVLLGPDFWGRNGIHRDATLQSPFLSESPLPQPLPAFEWNDTKPENGVFLLTQTASSGWAAEAENEFRLLVELVDGCAQETRSNSETGGSRPRKCGTKTWSVAWLGRDPAGSSARHRFLVRLKGGEKKCSEEFLSGVRVPAAGLKEASCPPDVP